MAISLDQINAIINVEIADLTFVAAGQYTFNTDTFRQTLRQLEDDVENAVYPITHRHVQPITVGGVALARVIEILPHWSVEFEDGQYRVTLQGSNNNILDVAVVNQVSIAPTNSAGLTYSKQVEDQAFTDSRIWIDIAAGQAGTDYPLGTPGSPVNNLADAQSIISTRTLPPRLHLRGSLTVGAADNIDSYDIEGIGDVLSSVTFTAGCSTQNARFEGLAISGAMDGTSVFEDCAFTNLTGFDGSMTQCRLGGDVTLAATASTVTLVNCQSNVAGSGKPGFDCNSASGLNINVRDYFGGFALRNFNQAGNNISFDSSSIRLELESSCTAGVAVIGGTGRLTDNSAGTFVNDLAFNNVSDEEALKIEEIHRRLDLVGNQVYADDGSTISNPVFSLTKVDNGDGTFTIVRDIGAAATSQQNLWRGAVEPASVTPAGNQVALWRGAIEPANV